MAFLTEHVSDWWVWTNVLYVAVALPSVHSSLEIYTSSTSSLVYK